MSLHRILQHVQIVLYLRYNCFYSHI